MYNKIIFLIGFLFTTYCYSNTVTINCNSDLEGSISLNEIHADSSLTFYGNKALNLGNNTFQFSNIGNHSSVLRIDIFDKNHSRCLSSIIFFTSDSDNSEISFKIIDSDGRKNFYNCPFKISGLKFKNTLSDVNSWLFQQRNNNSSDISDDYRKNPEKELRRLDSLWTVSFKEIETLEKENHLSFLQQFILRYYTLTMIDISATIICKTSDDSSQIRKVINHFFSDNMMDNKELKIIWYHYFYSQYIDLLYLLSDSEYFNSNFRYNYIYSDSGKVKNYYNFLKFKCNNNPIIISNVISSLLPPIEKDKYLYLLNMAMHDLYKNKSDEECKNFINRISDLIAKNTKLLPGNPLKYDITLIDTGGKEYLLSYFKDKVVYIDIWSLSCGPCLKLLPKLTRLQNLLKDSNEVVILNINVDDFWNERWKKYIKEKNVTGISLQITKKDKYKLFSDVNLSGYPRYVLLDKGLIKILYAPPADKVYDTIIEMLK